MEKQGIDNLTLYTVCFESPDNEMMVFGNGAFGKQLGHDDGALMNEISALIRDTGIRSSFSHKRKQQEDSHLRTCKRVFIRH